jgi:hypothetical protein
MRGGMTRACPMLVVVGCPCRYVRACFVITLVAMSLFPLKLKMPDHRYRHYTNGSIPFCCVPMNPWCYDGCQIIAG